MFLATLRAMLELLEQLALNQCPHLMTSYLDYLPQNMTLESGSL